MLLVDTLLMHLLNSEEYYFLVVQLFTFEGWVDTANLELILAHPSRSSKGVLVVKQSIERGLFGVVVEIRRSCC
jgi:hypothetical protein